MPCEPTYVQMSWTWGAGWYWNSNICHPSFISNHSKLWVNLNVLGSKLFHYDLQNYYSIFAQLYWLTIPQEFKFLVLIFKSVHGCATSTSSNSSTHSAGTNLLSPTLSMVESQHICPHWNSINESLQLVLTLASFKILVRFSISDCAFNCLSPPHLQLECKHWTLGYITKMIDAISIYMFIVFMYLSAEDKR